MSLFQDWRWQLELERIRQYPTAKTTRLRFSVTVSPSGHENYPYLPWDLNPELSTKQSNYQPLHQPYHHVTKTPLAQRLNFVTKFNTKSLNPNTGSCLGHVGLSQRYLIALNVPP